MNEEQIWEQLDLRTKTICRVLDFVLEGELEEEGKNGDTETDDDDEDEGENKEDKTRRLLKALEDLEGEGIDMDEDEGEDEGENKDDETRRLLKALEDLEGKGIDMDDVMDEESESFDQSSGSDVEDNEGDEKFSSLHDPSEDEGDSEVGPVLRSPNQPYSPKKRGRKAVASELDDDFFNLAEFNADSERAEAKSSSKGRLAEDDESDEDTDIDMFASVDNVEDNPDGISTVSYNVFCTHGYCSSFL